MGFFSAVVLMRSCHSLYQHLFQPGLQQAIKARVWVLDQGLARAVLADLPLLQDHDLIGALHRVQAVRDDDGRAAFRAACPWPSRSGAAQWHPGGKKPRPGSPGPGRAGKPASGPRAGPLRPKGCARRIASLVSSPCGSLRYHSSSPKSSSAATRRSSANAAVEEGQVVPQRGPEQLHFLGDHRHALAQHVQVRSGAGRLHPGECSPLIGSAMRNTSRVRVVLPLPVRPSRPNTRAGFEREAEVVQHRVVRGVVVGKVHMLKGQGQRAGGSIRSPVRHPPGVSILRSSVSRSTLAPMVWKFSTWRVRALTGASSRLA